MIRFIDAAIVLVILIGVPLYSAVAANKCCEADLTHNGCSDCVEVAVDTNGDGEIDENDEKRYIDVGDHAGKKCVTTQDTKTCDEESRKCGQTLAHTLYKNTVALGKCNQVVGAFQGEWFANQCGDSSTGPDDDDSCSIPE